VYGSSITIRQHSGTQNIISGQGPCVLRYHDTKRTLIVETGKRCSY